jgi:DNA-binding LacI/PurR family transcriptional regulator
MAKAAVSILMERVEHPEAPPEKRVLAGTLFTGSSTKD